MIAKNDVIEYIWNVKESKELTDIYKIMRKRLSQLKEQAIYSFCIGDRVMWQMDKTATTVTGTVMQLRKTNVAVKSDDGRRWLIPATMLTKT